MRLLALLLIAVPLGAKDLDLPVMECKRPHCLMVSEQELDKLIASNNTNFDRAEAAEKRLKELEAGAPKCAKVEVTEPPKKLPPLSKDRDL